MNDGLTYEWTHHDGQCFARQSIKDPANGLSLDIELVKNPSSSQSKQISFHVNLLTFGGEWMTRVHVNSLNGGSQIASIISYAYLDGVDESVGFEVTESVCLHKSLYVTNL